MEKQCNHSFSVRSIALAVAIAAASSLTLPAGAVAAAVNTGPELRLFPSTVVQDIQDLGKNAAQIEQGLQPEIEDMEKLMNLIKASQCEDGGDPGCAEMHKQLAERYKAMLQKMDEVLPRMADGVKRVRIGLEKRISSKLGRGTSATGMQEMLIGTTQPASRSRSYKVPGSSRLSARFQQYYHLVAGGNASGSGSLALVAADVYRDMAESEQLIAVIRDQIARSMLHLEVAEVMPGITPEMEATVSSTKALIFGEQQGVGALPDPVAAASSAGGAYRSPLEM